MRRRYIRKHETQSQGALSTYVYTRLYDRQRQTNHAQKSNLVSVRDKSDFEATLVISLRFPAIVVVPSRGEIIHGIDGEEDTSKYR